MKARPDLFEGFFSRLQRRRVFKRIYAVVKWTVLSILLFCIAAWFLLQQESVQNWALKKVTTYLSNELDSRVEAQRIDFDFFNKLVLEGFYLEDHKGDTLLYSKTLKASLSTDLISILQSQLHINDIYLENAQINMVRDTGEYRTNIETLLQKLQSEPDTTYKEGKPFYLGIDALYLSQIQFVKDDRVSGQLIEVE